MSEEGEPKWKLRQSALHATDRAMITAAAVWSSGYHGPIGFGFHSSNLDEVQVMAVLSRDTAPCYEIASGHARACMSQLCNRLLASKPDRVHASDIWITVYPVVSRVDSDKCVEVHVMVHELGGYEFHGTARRKSDEEASQVFKIRMANWVRSPYMPSPFRGMMPTDN